MWGVWGGGGWVDRGLPTGGRQRPAATAENCRCLAPVLPSDARFSSVTFRAFSLAPRQLCSPAVVSVCLLLKYFFKEPSDRFNQLIWLSCLSGLSNMQNMSNVVLGIQVDAKKKVKFPNYTSVLRLYLLKTHVQTGIRKTDLWTKGKLFCA